MSAAKMVADSTQGDVLEMSSTKKRKKMVQKKKVKKKKEKESSRKTKKKTPEREFDESDLDLEKEVHSIGFYVKDREGLLEQMIHCVKGPSLERALPDILKDMPIDDLKQRCLQQLLVMSKKRIQRILAGDDPSTISSSGTEDETSEEEIQEMEDNDDIDRNEANIVDSTSLYDQASDDSDRHIDDDDDDDDDDGSMVHSTISPYPSDVEQQNQCQYEEDSDLEVQSEIENPEVEYESNSRQAVNVKEPEDPEEGEVFDDSDDNDIIANKEIVTNVGEVVSVETDDEAETKYNTNIIETPECAEQETKAIEVDVDAQIDYVAKKVSSNENKGITPCEGVETSETCDENIVSIKENVIRDDVSVVIDESRKIPKTEHRDSVVGENIPEISIEDTGDVEFIDEGGDKSESEGQTDGELSEEENNQTQDTEANIGEGTSGGTVQQSQPTRRIVKPPSKEIAPALTRNQMELLELEMRARAIKAMLKTAK